MSKAKAGNKGASVNIPQSIREIDKREAQSPPVKMEKLGDFLAQGELTC